MLTFLQFLKEDLLQEAPEGTVYHMHEIDHPNERGRKALLVAAYHKASSNGQLHSYTVSQLATHAKEHPPGLSHENGIGFAILQKANSGKIHRAYRLHTDSDWTRRGVATGMYDHVKSKGVDLRPSTDQSENGKKFWKGYKKHLKNS